MPRKPASAPPKLSLLGPFRLETESGPVHLSTRKVETLLAYLALHPEEHTREKLAAIFWGDSTDTQARDSLRTALKNLRKQVGDDLLLADRETVQLNPEFPMRVDVRELADTVSRAAGGEPLAIDRLQSGVGLYRGDLLAEYYDDWIVSERERYRMLYLEALLRLAEELRTAGEYGRAVELAQRVLAADAADERAHRQLISCYFALGNKAGALKQYAECARVLRQELDIEPSSETTALYHEIKESGSVQKSVTARLTNVPLPLTSFVGRQREIKEIKDLLAQRRLVTLVGAGGSGKTRLAIQVGTDFLEEFEDGVWWVELAALSDPALVPAAVAKALAVRELPNQPFSETLANYLRSKRMLLVLDNCEHLVEACAELAGILLNGCASLKVLATSREALGLTGEYVWQVPTLSLPDAHSLPLPQLLARYEGIQLFVERANAVKSDFEVTARNAFAVAKVCRRLDGIPLAIELAAARVKVLSPEEIAARLDDRFELLTLGSRMALPRQQTLRATIDWSFGLLTEGERILFRRLSVFAGGFTLKAARAVCAAEGVGQAQILDLLSHLVDKSLVVVEAQAQGADETRYRMLETIREYAREKLVEAGEENIVGGRHLEFFLNLAEEIEPKLERAEQHYWLDHLEMEIDNLRAAIEWALKTGQVVAALRLAGSLRRFWVIRDHHNEAAERLKGMFGLPNAKAPTPARLKALNTYFFILWASGRLLEAQVLLDEAMQVGEKLGDHLNWAFALLWAGVSAVERGDFPRARSYIEHSREIGEESRDATFEYMSLTFSAEIRLFQDDYFRAQALLEEAVPRLREVGDYPFLGMVHRRLGQLAINRRELNKAIPLIQESLSNNLSIRDYRGVGAALVAMGALSAGQGKNERAARLFGAVDALLDFIHTPLVRYDQQQYERNVTGLRDRLDEPTFANAWAEGRAMTLESAIDYAFEDAVNG